jgi:signal transduction histidine kinase
MLQALRARFGSDSGRRWRVLLGLAIMLASIAQSTTSVHDALRLQIAVVLAIVMAYGFLLQLGSGNLAGVWILGLAATALMLVAPGSGAVIGVIAAVVTAAMRAPVREGAIAALVLGTLFVGADLWQTHADSLVGTALTGVGIAFAYLAAASVRRLRQEQERTAALLAELQQTRASEIERAALAERARIAREIHDVLAHTLSSLAVQLQGTLLLIEQRPGDPAAVAAVERAHRLATEGLAEARRAVGALRGDTLPGPDGLQRLVEDFEQATGTPSRFEVDGEPLALGAEAQLALYRTAQEALTNIRKHAQDASAIAVRLQYTPGGTELVVEDTLREPVLVAPGAANDWPGWGYGLVGMRERAELAGGSLEAGPLPTGFRVRLWLPTA